MYDLIRLIRKATGALSDALAAEEEAVARAATSEDSAALESLMAASLVAQGAAGRYQEAIQRYYEYLSELSREDAQVMTDLFEQACRDVRFGSS